jgi:hypothetical protein
MDRFFSLLFFILNKKSNNMKRYFAFYGDQYYPERGMGDFIGSYETKESAIESINNMHLQNGYEEDYWGIHFGSVWDSKEHKEVYSK